MVDADNFRTYQWPSAVELAQLDLRFCPIALSNADFTAPVAMPWGFLLGSVLAIHPVHLSGERDLEAPCWFRVSAVESGGAIADFPRIELALGFAAEVAALDWSGGPKSAAEIVARLRDVVPAAYRKWADPPAFGERVERRVESTEVGNG